MSKTLLVVKFGTSAITNSNGEPEQAVLERIASELAVLHKKHHIVMVSSGAVGAGKKFIANYDGSISKRKAAASIGNPLLIIKFSEVFAKYGIHVAQSLCERTHFADRERFLQLKDTYQELWQNDIIPIANENDVISDRELKFSDNDELATQIAVGFGAEKLMIATESGGLLDKEKKIVSLIPKIDESVMGLVDTSISALGLGGMSSKLTFAKMATRMGVKVTIFGIKTHQEGILSAYEGKSGSTFEAQEANITARNKWLASGSLTTATVILDEGATAAVKKRKSLLAVGISGLEGQFDTGEVVELKNANAEVIAIARVRASSEVLSTKPQNLIVAHADDIVLL